MKKIGSTSNRNDLRTQNPSCQLRPMLRQMHKCVLTVCKYTTRLVWKTHPKSINCNMSPKAAGKSSHRVYIPRKAKYTAICKNIKSLLKYQANKQQTICYVITNLWPKVRVDLIYRLVCKVPPVQCPTVQELLSFDFIYQPKVHSYS